MMCNKEFYINFITRKENTNNKNRNRKSSKYRNSKSNWKKNNKNPKQKYIKKDNKTYRTTNKNKFSIHKLFAQYARQELTIIYGSLHNFTNNTGNSIIKTNNNNRQNW